MTMAQSEQHKHGKQEKGLRKFHKKFDLNVTAPELERQPDAQWELLENHYNQYSESGQRTEKHKDHHGEEAQQHGEQVPQTKTLEGCVDRLLILAQSAEIVAQSEDSVAGMPTNNQNKGSHNNLVDQMSQEYAGNVTAYGHECSKELLDGLSVDSIVSNQRCEFCYEVTRPRLTQIRKQARSKYLIFDQERIEDNQCKHLQGKTIRLSQIKHHARYKSKNGLLPQEMITGRRNEQLQGRAIRLSQMKHQARSKCNSIAKEGSEEHMDGRSLHCNEFEDSILSVVESVPASKFFSGAQSSVGSSAETTFRMQQATSHQFAAVIQDDETLREQQRTARRLRAFKTKKLREQLRTECLRNSAKKTVHAMKMSPIGLTSISNPWPLSRSTTLVKDNDLIARQQELHKTSGCTEKFRANFGAEKLQGHLGPNELSGLRLKSHQHIPNGLPLQKVVQNTSFTASPNIFHQYHTNVGWMLYMHHMQLKEYHWAVAHQHRAERIEEKRASKDKHQNSKKKVQSKTASMIESYEASLKMDEDFQHLANSLFNEVNSEVYNEFMPVKRKRLTQLRREVRSGNRPSVFQGPSEN